MARGDSHDQNFKSHIALSTAGSRILAAEDVPASDEQVKVTPIRQEQLKQRLGDRFRELDVPVPVKYLMADVKPCYSCWKKGPAFTTSRCIVWLTIDWIWRNSTKWIGWYQL